MSKAISVVVIGRSLNQQERTRLRSSSQTPLAIVAELPNAPQVLDELNRLRPQAALMLLNGDLHHSFQLVERIHQELPETAVICSSEDNSPDVILRSFRSGAMEFLRQPLVESEIASVFSKIEQIVIKPEDSHGRVITVYASKGGCGTTFVTANLAASLSKISRKRACVVDLNLQAGDQPLYLGVEPNYSIHDVVKNFDRLDDQLLASYLTQRSKLLSLLAAPTEISKDEDVQVEHITRSIALLRSQVDFIVIDPPHMLNNELTISALDAADVKILLLTLDVPAIRSAKRALDIFTRLGYDRNQIKVVINRYAKTPELDLKQVGKVLETEVYATISNDYQAAISSINVGEPLVLSKNQSRVIQDFGHLANKLSGVRSSSENSEAPVRQKSGGWSSLFGGKR